MSGNGIWMHGKAFSHVDCIECTVVIRQKRYGCLVASDILLAITSQ